MQISQRSTALTLPYNIEHVEEELVSRTCKGCELLPSKPGNTVVAKTVEAATDSAIRLKQQLDSGLAQIIYRPDDISCKRAAALDAYLAAESKSERNRYPKKKNESKPKIEPFE